MATALPAINAVASKAGERLRFRSCMTSSSFMPWKSPHKSFTPTCDYATYLRLLGSSEISFMPLADTPFNRAKSDLKFIEAGSRRVAALASTVVYGDSVEDGRTGLLFRDASELHSRLAASGRHARSGLQLADAAREYVLRERMLAYQVAPRIAWYRSLWDRRDLLAAALCTDECRRPRHERRQSRRLEQYQPCLIAERPQADEIAREKTPEQYEPDSSQRSDTPGDGIALR